MVVPVADQERLRAILAFDLQPRIQWAYDLEQDVDGLGAGYVTVGNGDPNGLVTKPEGYLFLDLTTPAVWQNQNGGTVWSDISAGGGGAPTTADYLVGTTQAGLSAEIVVGTAPGGELGGTWASPTVDTTHSGSSHAGVQGAAEATAASALSAHVTDATDAHDASAVSVVPFGTIAATDVQAALEEVVAAAGSLTDAVILAPTTSARNVIEGTGDITGLTVKATDDEAFYTSTFRLLDAADNEVLHVQIGDASGSVDRNVMRLQNGDAFVYFHAASDPGVYNESAFSLNDNVEGVFTENLVTPSDSEAFWYVQALDQQLAPLLRCDGEVDGSYGSQSRVFEVLVTGSPVVNAVTEPDDSTIGNALRPSGLTYWLDDTAGAPTIKFKAKDVNGDLFTATIPMTAV